MANKAISELPQAQNVNNQDLFVLEQSGIAKKLTAETFITEQGIIDALAEALDGHGGIQSVTLSSVSGRIRTYLITFTDGSATTFQVYDGTTIERIAKTSTAGLVDTYTVFMNDGTTTFFTVTNGADGTVSEAMLNDALKDKAPAITETTESSAIATFADGADDMVMHNVVVEINPVQSGSGDPSPDNIRPISGWTGANVYRTGKNLFDESKYQNLTSTYEYSNDSYHCKAIQLVPNTTFTVSHRAGTADSGVIALINNVQKVNNGVFFDLRTASGSKTFTTDSTGCLYIGVLYSNDTAYNARLALCQVQIELGSTATDYEAYQGTTLTVDWTTEAGTVYGGTIDVATGLLTVDRAIVDMGTLNWGHQAGYFYAAIAGIKQTTTTSEYPHVICSSYKAVRQSVWANNKPCVSQISGGKAILVGDDTYATAADFKAAVTGQTLCYELATPQTYQLTPQQLMTLLGTNNVWADTGDTSVTYPADTKLFIEKLTMPTEDDLVANQAITSGKYFMIGNSLYLALANIASGAQITIGTNAQRVSLADALNAINS